jgi:protein gp37
MKNKIGWCSMTWNPVWGCLNHCEYCYARKIAKRFWKQMLIIECGYYCNQRPSWTWHGQYYSNLLFNLKPVFLYSQSNKKFPKKPQRIFVGSMSEIYYWDEKWFLKVFNKIDEYPQHTFQFLTRHPEIYLKYDFPKNCWLGVTITETGLKAKYEINWEHYFGNNRQSFFSFEPLLENINPYLLRFVNKKTWVIIGAETGNRKDKIIPERKWIAEIVHYCRENDIPIYLKDSLKDIYPVEIKEFPI